LKALVTKSVHFLFNTNSQCSIQGTLTEVEGSVRLTSLSS
jgi:hypothetical protein